MATKSKQKRLREKNRIETATIPIIISIIVSSLILLLNNNGQFSDILDFYQLHFRDGQHVWPYSYHTLIGATQESHPVEYPVLTGLIMWLISFFITPSETGYLSYFRLTSVCQVLVFGAATYYLKKISNRKMAIIFALTPAVLYSLNRNWDIWAIITMLIAIHYFEKNKKNLSAFWLAVSVATKFFPIVLLLPISIYFIRKKQIRAWINYLGITVGIWLILNFPFMLINFHGFFYFYQNSFKRGIGSGSIFEVISRIGVEVTKSNIIFYLLNSIVLIIIMLYLTKSNAILSLPVGAFFTMFAFMLFNKQYSMQYVIWLAGLSLLAIFRLTKVHQIKLLKIYAVWQLFEFAFQYTYFQNIFSNAYAGTEYMRGPVVSGFVYGIFGLFRYALAFFFTLCLAYYFGNGSKLERA